VVLTSIVCTMLDVEDVNKTSKTNAEFGGLGFLDSYQQKGEVRVSRPKR